MTQVCAPADSETELKNRRPTGPASDPVRGRIRCVENVGAILSRRGKLGRVRRRIRVRIAAWWLPVYSRNSFRPNVMATVVATTGCRAIGSGDRRPRHRSRRSRCAAKPLRRQERAREWSCTFLELGQSPPVRPRPHHTACPPGHRGSPHETVQLTHTASQRSVSSFAFPLLSFASFASVSSIASLDSGSSMPGTLRDQTRPFANEQACPSRNWHDSTEV